ncbi:MAG: hypothetical protein RIS70_66 [Planctomycetota bacterium]
MRPLFSTRAIRSLLQITTVLGLFVSNGSLRLQAADTVDPALAKIDAETRIAWYDAKAIGLEGQAWSETRSPYDRLPAKAEGVVRAPVWELSHHAAGLLVPFATSSPVIHARWTLTSSRLEMPHMPATGVSGLDLYVRVNDRWRWLANGRPAQQTNTAQLVAGLAAERREYLLYLPLYNGVSAVEIGIASDASIERQPRAAERRKPIVFWGTSITQGGCASRPGMVHTAIVGRRLNWPVVNLGFSGNGKLEPEMARLIAEIDAAVFVLDCLPNLSPDEVAKLAEPAVRILREARPDTPILLVEDRDYSDAFLVESKRNRNRDSQAALHRTYERLNSDGCTQLHYLKAETLFGNDGEDTVDSSHPTDLGFSRMADAFEAALKPLLKP